MDKSLKLKIGNDIYTYQDAVKHFGKHHVDNWYKYPEMLAGDKPRATGGTRKNSDVKASTGEKSTQPQLPKFNLTANTAWGLTGSMLKGELNTNRQSTIPDAIDLNQVTSDGYYTAKQPATSLPDMDKPLTEFYRRTFTYQDFVHWHDANFKNGDDVEYIFNAYSKGTLGHDDVIVLHGTVTMYFAQHRAYYYLYNQSGLPISYTQDLKSDKYHDFKYNVFPTNGEMAIGQEMYKLVDNDTTNNTPDHVKAMEQRKDSRDKIKSAFQSITEPNKAMEGNKGSSTGDEILRGLAEDKSLDMFTLNDSDGHATTYVKKKHPADDNTSAYQPDVTHPNYYSEGGKDVIDCLPDLVGYTGTVGFLQGNVIKYTVRFQRKNGIEDLDKAKVYLDRLAKLYKEHNHDDHDSSKPR